MLYKHTNMKAALRVVGTSLVGDRRLQLAAARSWQHTGASVCVLCMHVCMSHTRLAANRTAAASSQFLPTKATTLEHRSCMIRSLDFASGGVDQELQGGHNGIAYSYTLRCCCRTLCSHSHCFRNGCRFETSGCNKQHVGRF